MTTYCRNYIRQSDLFVSSRRLYFRQPNPATQGPHKHYRLAVTVENIRFISRISNIPVFYCRSRVLFMKKVIFPDFYCK